MYNAVRLHIVIGLDIYESGKCMERAWQQVLKCTVNSVGLILILGIEDTDLFNNYDSLCIVLNISYVPY